MSAKELLTIDELARMSGLTTRTIRFYAQEKLMPPPAKFKGRTALYNADHVKKLKLVKTLKDEYFFPLAFIRKFLKHPEKIAKMKKHLRMSEEVLALLGYQRIGYAQTDMAKVTGFEPEAIDKLATMGFFYPGKTEQGLRFSADDLRIAHMLKELADTGFHLEELGFIPARLNDLAKTFFKLGHEKFHDAVHAEDESLKIDPAKVTKMAANVLELITVLFRQLLRQAFDKHHEAGDGWPGQSRKGARW